MKKVLRNKNIIAFALFAVLTAGLAATAQAKGSDPVVPVELKFLGNVNDKPVFMLYVEGNPDENEFTITISDDYGNRLYKETVKEEKFSKRFALDTESLGDAELRFEITSNKSNKPVVFEINRQSHLIDEVVVNKL